LRQPQFLLQHHPVLTLERGHVAKNHFVASIPFAKDVRTIARELKARGGDRVILITSKYHARRVKVLWRILTGQSAKAIVRYAPDDPFQPDRWWRNTGDAMSVTRELFGLMNAWAGFPVKSERW
jgi:hypothetical protein